LTAVFAADWPDIEYEMSSAPFGTPSANTPASPIDERVVDASAFPMLTPGHSKSMVCVLAEKIATDILAGNRGVVRRAGDLSRYSIHYFAPTMFVGPRT
jgi:hypothetical protein